MTYFLLSLLWIVALVYTIKGIFERNDLDQTSRLLWTLIILVAPVLGMLVYYVFGNRNRRI